jgi:hypothetical protein
VLDAKVRGYSHVQLQYLLEQARAVEYLFLTDFRGIDLDILRSKRLSATEYQHFLSEAHLQLTQHFSRAAQTYSQGRTQKTSHTTIALADIPAQRDQFATTGALTVSLTPPVGTSYYDVTFKDVSVYLVGLKPSAQQTVTINLVRGGALTFIDGRNHTRRFTTKANTQSPMQCSYDSRTCRGSPAGGQTDRFQGNLWIQYPPYCTWSLQVQQHAAFDLKSVTAVRFEFTLFARVGTFGGTPVFFVDSDGTRQTARPPLGAQACTAQAKPDPCPACINGATFATCMKTVNAKCCDEKSEDCSSGEPATCNAGCAAVLVPANRKCQAGFFSLPGMAVAMAHAKHALSQAAAKCKSTVSQPCHTLHDYTTLVQDMSKACCTDSKNCQGGAPTRCDVKCASSLHALVTACKSYMQSAPSYYGTCVCMWCCLYACIS